MTAKRDPKCRLTSIIRLSGIFNISAAINKCPELEIGKNSVIPWIIPNSSIGKKAIRIKKILFYAI